MNIMKWIIFFLLFAIAAASLGLLHLQYPGFVIIKWLNYDIRFSIIIGALLLILVFCILALLIHGLLWILGLPQKWTSSYHHSQEKKAKQELLDLLTSYEAEILPAALHHQKKASKALSKNSFFLWISGNTFEKANKFLEAEKCFMGLTENSSSLFLGLKGQIRSAFHRNDGKGAYEFLKRAEESVPTSPWVLKHLLALTREQKKFEEAQNLILRLEDLGYLSAEQSKKQMAYLQYQQALEPTLPAEEKEVLLRQSHYLDPSLSEATVILAPLLQDKGHSTYALTVLEATWKAAPTQTIGDLYLKMASPENPEETYKIAKQLTSKNASQPESLLLLARMAFQAHLWGEARTHLEELLKAKGGSTAEAYDLFAKLELEEHKDWKAAIAWFEKGLNAPRHV